MSNVPTDLKFMKSHEWIRIAADTATVGISDFAQQQISDITFIELPQVGRKVKAGESCAVVESTKSTSDIYSPVSGEVVESNKAVGDNPALTNSDPYGQGWLFKVRMSNAGEVTGLLTPDAYKKEIGE